MSYINIVLNIIPTRYPLWGLYSISAQNGYGKSSCWPWQYPGQPPTYILHKDKKLEHARTIFCVELSINNHIVGLVHKNHTRHQVSYTNVSDVPRSLQSWVSTIPTVVLTADVFQLFKNRSVAPLDAARVKRTIFHNHSVHWYYITHSHKTW